MYVSTQQHRVDPLICLTYHGQTAFLTSPVSYRSPEIKIEQQTLREESPHISASLLPACLRRIRSGLVGSYLLKLGSSVKGSEERIDDKDEMSCDL